MVDNFFFEIENYGAMLNANRTYYLTRSQPPFLSSMFVDVYDTCEKVRTRDDQAWLARAYADLEKDYEMWNRDPHLAGDTGLVALLRFRRRARRRKRCRTKCFYRKVATYFFFHPGASGQLHCGEPAGSDGTGCRGRLYAAGVRARSTMARAECEKRREFKLSSDYYKGDRSMRESGFDVSFRFGPFGAATQHYAPVCLNSLLYKTEKDLEQISRWLGRHGRCGKVEQARRRTEETDHALSMG